MSFLEMALQEAAVQQAYDEGAGPMFGMQMPSPGFGFGIAQQPRQAQPRQPARQQPVRPQPVAPPPVQWAYPPAQRPGLQVVQAVANAAARAEIGIAATEAIRPNKCAGLVKTPTTTVPDGATLDLEVELPGHCTITTILAREIDDENFLCNSFIIDDVQLVHSGPVGLTVFLAMITRDMALTPVIQRTFTSAVKIKAQVLCVAPGGARMGAITINMQTQPCVPASTVDALQLLNLPNMAVAQRNLLNLARAA